MTYAEIRPRPHHVLIRTAADFGSAAGRAALQGKTETVQLIYELAGRPSLDELSLAGRAYTLSVEGTGLRSSHLVFVSLALLGWTRTRWSTSLALIAGNRQLSTASWRCIDVEHGFEPPDTPVMALHRGRIDLMELHLSRDPDLLTRTFDIADVFPLERGMPEEGHGGGPLREYRNVTPLGFGEQFHTKIFVSRESLRLIEARGGGRI